MAEALRDVDWVSAMQDELDQFARLKVWRLVPRPEGKTIIKTKWIFKNKKDESSLFIRNKARLVATAFLNGILKEEGYVGQPPGFVSKQYIDHMYTLNKSLYCLKQAPRACSHPMVEQAKLKLDFVGKPVDYRSMIGSLMYVTSSRPDIMFATYHARCHLDQKSTSGSVQFLGNADLINTVSATVIAAIEQKASKCIFLVLLNEFCLHQNSLVVPVYVSFSKGQMGRWQQSRLERRLSKLLQMGMVAEYHNEFEILINRVTRISQSLLTSFYISGLKLKLQWEPWRSRPTTSGEAFSLARIAEARFVESVTNRFGPSKYKDSQGALSKLLQLGTIEDYQQEFEKLMNKVTNIPDSLLISFYILGLKLNLQHELLMSRPTTLGDALSLARIIEAHFEAIAEKGQNIKEETDTTISLSIEEVSHVVKGPLDASEDTLLSLRSEDPNFKIQENTVEYVRALNAAPLKVVFAGPVDEVSSVIEDVFDIDESNVEGMQVRDKFVEFFEDKGSVKKVLSAIKLPKGGNSRSTYSSYHLEDKVSFEGVRNVTPWAAVVRRKERVKCYVEVSGRRKNKKNVIGRDSRRWFVMGWDNHHTYLLCRICG
nr:retrotransposon protein, putative, unclassified [Tanacetum cinerariifolium]